MPHHREGSQSNVRTTLCLAIMLVMIASAPPSATAEAPAADEGSVRAGEADLQWTDAPEPTEPPRWSSAGPAGHAPLGVMGDHTHGGGEWMLAYIFSRDIQNQLRDGASRVNVDEVYEHFPMVPLDMTMDMHMGHVMYAPTDRVTLMAMAMWMQHRMDTRMADSFHGDHGDHDDHDGHGHGPHHVHPHSVSGLSDAEFSALVTLWDRNRRRVHLNLGVVTPVGSITASEPAMHGEGEERLSYPMQLGSGSWEARPGITLLQQTRWLSLGAQAMGIFRLNENSAGYRWGPALLATGWAQLRGNAWVAPGLRLAHTRRSNILGADPAIDPALSPENDPNRQGGSRLRAYASLNFQVPRGPLAGHRLAVEWGRALWESLDGPQLGGGFHVALGWEYAL